MNKKYNQIKIYCCNNTDCPSGSNCMTDKTPPYYCQTGLGKLTYDETLDKCTDVFLNSNINPDKAVEGRKNREGLCCTTSEKGS